MTILFRPRADLTRAPKTATPEAALLANRLRQATGLQIQNKAPTFLLDTWAETACLLDGAIASGVDVMVLPHAPLTEALAMPSLYVEGARGPHILLGPRRLGDVRDAARLGLHWPPANSSDARRYAETETFRRLAGVDFALAGLPASRGQAALPAGRARAHSGEGLGIGEALARFAGRSCLVTDVRSTEVEDGWAFTIPSGANPEDCLKLFKDRIQHEPHDLFGKQDHLLVTSFPQVTHKTRVFVVGGQVACATALIGLRTPLSNPEKAAFPTRFEVRENVGPERVDYQASGTLHDFAHEAAQTFVAEVPEVTSFAMDVALDARGRAVVLELHDIAAVRLLGVDHHRLVSAIVLEAQCEKESGAAGEVARTQEQELLTS